MQLPTAGICKLSRQHIAAPTLDCFEGFEQMWTISLDAHLTPHERPKRIPNVSKIERLGNDTFNRAVLFGVGDQRNVKDFVLMPAPIGKNLRTRHLTGASAVD